MDGIVGSLRLGWKALLFKEDAYEEMGACITAGLSTDHIAEKYKKEDA